MHASLCFLSYNRVYRLLNAIHTARSNTDVPLEIIVHDDGSDPSVQSELLRQLHDGNISRLLLNPPGHNEGVGSAVNRSFKVSTGDYLLKLDQDLTFKPRWLEKAIEWHDSDKTIGMVGFFKYHAPPVVWTEQVIEGSPSLEYHYCHDFVSSAFLIDRVTYDTYGQFPEHSDAFAEDVEYKTYLRDIAGLRLALANEDLIVNDGFGIGPDRSTLFDLQGKVSAIHHGSKLL